MATPGPGSGGMLPDGSSEPSVVYEDGTMPPGSTPPGMSPDSTYDPSGYNPGEPSSGGMPGQQPAKPLTLAEKAVLAFRQGKDQDAIVYLCAHGITAEADEAKQVLAGMGWSVPLKRPTMAVRWGIAVRYVPLRGYTGSIFPIGTTQNVQVRGPASPLGGGQPMAGGDMAGGQAGMAAGVKSHPLLQQLTGELGARVLAQLQERIQRGDFGQALATLGKAATPAAGGAGMGMTGYGEMGGSGMGAEMGYGETMPGGYGAPGQAQGALPVEAVPLAPGIVFLGVVTPKDMRPKAEKAGVDVICLFDIVLTAIPKQQLLKNETAIQVYDLTQAKELFETKKLNNIQVQVERIERKSDQDPVDRELESLFAFVDSHWTVGALPASLQAEHVLNRLKVLLAEPQANPLPVLAEARMYQTRGLLQDAHYLSACRKLLGDSEGSQLVNGSAEEKLEVIAQWLPNGS